MMVKLFGKFGESVRYCIHCKKNTTFLKIKGSHSECLICHKTYSKKPIIEPIILSDDIISTNCPYCKRRFKSDNAIKQHIRDKHN